jgi:UDP-N-acetylglucosamine 1-carboxyvinyltransferase
MGADITVKGKTAIIKGVKQLNGAHVFASDLRGGASLVLAGLCANGETVVDNAFHIERGYFDLDKKLANLGGEIKRI